MTTLSQNTTNPEVGDNVTLVEFEVVFSTSSRSRVATFHVRFPTEAMANHLYNHFFYEWTTFGFVDDFCLVGSLAKADWDALHTTVNYIRNRTKDLVEDYREAQKALDVIPTSIFELM
jgi:hypothetical protein